MGTQAKGRMRALGLMSGTSLDGVDAALIETDGEEVFAFGPSVSFPYSRRQRAVLESATRDALVWGFDGPQPNSLSRAADIINNEHVEAVVNFASMTGLSFDDIDIIGFHGQTVLHHPPADKPGRTLQIGEGTHLAHVLGISVAYDFRSADVDAGGQGAPLAPIYHQALIRRSGLDNRTAVLNLGGVGNVTLFSPDLMASDTGPANGPLDQWMSEACEKAYDDRGATSHAGTPDFGRIDQWLRRDFFTRPTPRSADRYDFDVLSDMGGLSEADGAATLAAFTALSVKRTLADMGQVPSRVIVCGGGRHNATIMAMLREELGVPVDAAEAVGWDGDGLEAQAFGYLAVRCLKGLPISFPGTTGAPHPMTGGRLARPV